MLDGDQRYCDVCAEPIPRGTTYRSGYTTPDAVAEWRDDAPRLAPSFTPEPDGTVRIDVCEECAGESESIRACSQLAVDELH
jgi:hypothetical protein